MSNKDIAFSSDLLNDKICYTKTGSFVVGAANVSSYLYRIAIPHIMTRPMFMDALFIVNGTTTVPNAYNVIAYSDANNVYIMTYLAAGTTISYTLVGTWIDNYNATNPVVPVSLANANDEVKLFDSRVNYQSIALSGVSTATTTADISLSHSLGYLPQYQIFFEAFAGQVWPQISGGTGDIWLYDITNQCECSSRVTSSLLTLRPTIPSGKSANIWYRIYY